MLTLVIAFVLSAGQTTTDVAGTGKPGYAGDGGPATQALLKDPFDVALAPNGDLWFSDTSNHCVRRIDAKTGVIATVAGCGINEFDGDGGPAIDAKLNEPYGVLLDAAGNLYIVDRLNACVRKVEAKTGTISTVAGVGGKKGYSGDGGDAKLARMREPNGIAISPEGDRLLIADVADQRVRVVDLATGKIATFAGTGEKAHEGDGGPVAKASLFGPRAVAFGADGSLYVVEREGHCVRRIDAKTGVIDLFAGTTKKGYTGDGGPALAATFNGPKEIDIDADGNVYVVDTENNAIRRIDAKTRVITTAVGSLARPHGVAATKDGVLYIGDTLNHKVRRFRP